jgi:ribosomal protein S18 acetylase RimI-like enzyme
MTNTENHGLIKKRGLTDAEIAEIRQLASICDAHDHATIRVNWEMLANRAKDVVNDVLYYQNGALVGCLSLYSFSRREAEASGMVHPEFRRKGIFRALMMAALDELKQQGIPKLIFFTDYNSRSGIGFLEAIGAQYIHSEYRMDLEEPRMPESFDKRLRVERAGSADVEAIARIIALSFGLSEDEMRHSIARGLDSPVRRQYIARLDRQPIGTLNVTASDRDVGIYGFAVLPEYRGRGYGRQILARTIEYATAEYQKPIFLEVAPENSNALGLYQSVGFKETNRYDYYRIDVPQGTDASRTAQ